MPTQFSRPWRKLSARLLAPLLPCICVLVFIRYGCFADCRLMLGPGSSRLVQASSIFVQGIDIRGDGWNEAFLYEFTEKPELSCETNWTIADNVTVPSYSSKDYLLWLNKGSKINLRWKNHTSSFNNIQLVMSKGERLQQTLLPKETVTYSSPNGPTYGKEAQYTVQDDDKYTISFINTNAGKIMMSLNLNVSAKVYNETRATRICSTLKERKQLQSDHNGWYIGISFVARIISYFAILGVIGIVIFLALFCLQNCNSESDEAMTGVHQVSETEPLLGPKPALFTYGTNDDDDDEECGSSSSSSEDVYNERLCIICYDNRRHCFFVPCGHCATCYDCTKRIINMNKSCPVCRRVVHKVRRIFQA